VNRPASENIYLEIGNGQINERGYATWFLLFPNNKTRGDLMFDKNIILDTNQGKIEIKLMPDIAPKTCENFTRLVEKGYYDGVIFHRVIQDFMIQGGDPEGTGRGGQSIWGSKFEDEFSRDVKFDKVGLLAMANAGPNSNGSQFFITTSTANCRHLHMKHTIFGEVVSGYDIVKKIEGVETGMGDRPVKEQKIVKATVKS